MGLWPDCTCISQLRLQDCPAALEQATESGSRALRARQVLLTGCFALGNSFASVSQFPSRGLRSSLPSSPCFGGESLFAHAYRTHQFGLVNTSVVSERPPMAPVQDLISQAHVQFPRPASERLVASGCGIADSGIYSGLQVRIMQQNQPRDFRTYWGQVLQRSGVPVAGNQRDQRGQSEPANYVSFY